MTKGSVLSFCLLGLLAVAANCAQGAIDDSGVISPSGEGDAGRESLDASALALAEAGPKPAGNDGGGPGNDNDSGGTGNPDGGAGEDAGEDAAPIHDAGFDSGKGGKDAGSVVPTTCIQADEGFGCCVGNVNYYCSGTGSSVTKKACTTGKVCGWSVSSKYYDCVSPPAESDPSGTYPIACK